MEHSAALRKIPKADLHRHAETYAHLDRLIARLNNRPPHDWESWIEHLAELPPGMPRLNRLNGDLDTVALHALAVKYVYFDSWLIAMFEEAAHEGAMLVEVRFGVGDGLDPQHMFLFRQAERRIREKFPYFCAEAIAAVRMSALGQPDVFESCLRARDDGLAGIDFIPEPYDSEADWAGAYARADMSRRSGIGHHGPCGGVLNRQYRRSSETPGYQTDRPRRAHGGDRRTTAASSGLRRHRRVLPYLEL